MKEEIDAIQSVVPDSVRQAEVYRVIGELAKELILEESPDVIAGSLLSRARSLTQSPFGYVGKIDSVNGDFVCSTLTNQVFEECKIDDKKLVFHEFKGLWGWSLHKKRALISNDPANDPRAEGAPAGHIPIERFMAVPVLADGELLGQISLANAPEDYDPSDLWVLEQFAEVYSMALQRQKEIQALRLFHIMSQQATDGLCIIDPHTSRFLAVNEVCHKRLGYSREELLAKRVIDISATEPDMDSWKRHVEQLRQVEFMCFDGEQISRDGSILPVEVNVRLLQEGGEEYMVSVARDISERRAAERTLLEEKNKLEAVLAGLGDGISMQDRNFRVLYQNETHKARLGDCLGKRCYEAYQKNDRVCDGCQVQKCFADGKIHHKESSSLDQDGKRWHVAISASPLRDADGHIYAAIESFRDITKNKQLEEKLRQAQKHEAIGTLAGGIAHDFNNILSIIMGYSELIQLRLEPGSESAEMMGQVLQASSRARDLVKQILSFSRADEKKLIPLDVAVVVKEAMKMMRSSIPTTVEIEQEIDPRAGAVMADSTHLHQIIINLCTNAYQAMQESGGTLWVSVAQEELCQASNAGVDGEIPPGSYICLSVRDNGPGILSEEMSRIFDPYFTTKPKGQGTGLGLAVVMGIVKKCRGYITVESRQGEGVEFKVYLPSVGGGESGVGAANAQVSKEVMGERILVVDDEASVVDLERRILDSKGYDVVGAAGPLEALEILQKAPDEIDLIITDMTMPKMTGAQLVEQVRAVRADLPIILCTGYSNLIDKERAESLGISRYLMKPLSHNELTEAVAEALGGR